MPEPTVIVIGIGEVGSPLFRILSRTYRCTGIDISPVEMNAPCSVLHVCYPYQIADFIGTTLSYVGKYEPELTIINSTVAPGTTRTLQRLSRRQVVYSPVRGKHAKMESDLLRYRKFVAGPTTESTRRAADHFAQAGFLTGTFGTPEAAEVSKLVETTWLGVMVGWAQEVERMAAQYGATYTEINAFIEEIDFLPSHILPGHIGGHCVIPNIEILQKGYRSRLLEAIMESNQIKSQESKVATAGERS